MIILAISQAYLLSLSIRIPISGAACSRAAAPLAPTLAAEPSPRMNLDELAAPLARDGAFQNGRFCLSFTSTKPSCSSRRGREKTNGQAAAAATWPCL